MVDDGGLMVDDQQWIDYLIMIVNVSELNASEQCGMVWTDAIFCRKDVMPCELKVG